MAKKERPKVVAGRKWKERDRRSMQRTLVVTSTGKRFNVERVTLENTNKDAVAVGASRKTTTLKLTTLYDKFDLVNEK